MSIQNEIDRIITAVQAAHEKVAEKGGTTAQPYLVANLAGAIDSIPDASDPVLQEKTVTPKTSAQSVTPDSGYDGLSKVTVNAMPTATQATPSISVSSSGLITASATQTEGYVAAGTKSATKQLTTQAATTYTPGTSNQTISEGTYCSGAQTIKGDANLVAGNIKSGVSIFGVAGSYEGSGGSGGSSDVELVYVTFMSHDGLKELHKRAVVSGNDCMEIVAGGLIDAPTRESTASQVFTFAGWSTVANGGLDENALKSVTADRTVYANYIATTRYYTVRFYDGDTLLNTMQVPYGGLADYTTEKEGYQFNGWEPSNNNITADTDCYAQWAVQITFANATWAQIAEISEAGEAENYFAVGDTKQVSWGDDTITVAIAGFDHDDLADGSGKAGISIVCMSVPDYQAAWTTISPSSNNYSKYIYTGERTQLRTILDGDIWNGLPAELQSVVKNVNKLSAKSFNKYPGTVSTSEKLWLLSADEIGHSATADNLGPGTPTVPALGSKYDLFTTCDLRVNNTVRITPTVGSSNTYSYGWWLRTNCCNGTMNYPGLLYMKRSSNSYATGLISQFSLTSRNYTDTYHLRFGFCV